MRQREECTGLFHLPQLYLAPRLLHKAHPNTGRVPECNLKRGCLSLDEHGSFTEDICSSVEPIDCMAL